MYAGFAAREGEELRHITLGGSIFFANASLMKEMIQRMQEKHPKATFEIRKVEQHA